jgi:hypothetical protein
VLAAEAHAVMASGHGGWGMTCGSAGANGGARVTHAGGETQAWEAHFRHLEERMDRLDRTVGAAVDLLHSLLHPDKAAAKPGGPGRP